MDIHIIQRNAASAANLLGTLANRKRLMILCTLYKGERSAGDLAKALALRRASLSQHLARLREQNLVKTRRERTTIFYTLRDCPAKTLLRALIDDCRDFRSWRQ